jgi:hypothetical protein
VPAQFIEEDELFLMSNLSPNRTGLPFVVWVSPKGGDHHDVRIKVSLGPKAKPDEMVSVAVRTKVEVAQLIYRTATALRMMLSRGCG